MPLTAFLEPAHLLQALILALSIFNLVTFLWLVATVWLSGDRRTSIARLGVIGLGCSAFFFSIHALIIASSLVGLPGQISQDFLWRLIWLPAISVPYIWFAIGLHYAALINANWHKRRPFLLISSGLLGLLILLLLIVYRATFTFAGTLRMLAYGDLFDDQGGSPFSLSVLLPILFLFYVTFCAIGPWFTLGRIVRVVRAIWGYIAMPRPVARPAPSLWRTLADAFWDDPTEVELLEEPVLSWHLARPGLFLSAILMVGLTTTLGVLGIWSLADWFGGQRRNTASLPALTLSIIPLNLLVLDALATGAVALIILLLGYSIVRHGILIERPLARRGFFEQWRGIVIVATAVALFITLLVVFTHSDLGGLLLITSMATCVYALFTWSSYTAHDRYIALLGPFLRSTNTNVRHWLNTDLYRTERGLEDLFVHLCHDVLAVQCARLAIVAGPVRRNFSYRWPAQAKEQLLNVIPKMTLKRESCDEKGMVRSSPSHVRLTVNGQPMVCWVLPIYDELGLVAMLYLGPREDGGAFTDEDMDLAHACGQRILDTLRDHEAMQAVASLLRRRIVDVKLMGAQQRRILHDDILPQMHLALLRLETLRRYVRVEKATVNDACQEHEERAAPEMVLDEAVGMISEAHRRLAAMMRATAPSAPHRLEHDGLMNAIHTMLAQDFQHAFDEVVWDVSEETADCIDEVTPPAIAELIFAAVQEALRNAARHARGSDVHRHLCLTLKAVCHREEPSLEVFVADDGVGLLSANSATTGTGGGLLTHSALLAIAGGSLTIKSEPGQGVTVRIQLSAEFLR